MINTMEEAQIEKNKGGRSKTSWKQESNYWRRKYEEEIQRQAKPNPHLNVPILNSQIRPIAKSSDPTEGANDLPAPSVEKTQKEAVSSSAEPALPTETTPDIEQAPQPEKFNPELYRFQCARCYAYFNLLTEPENRSCPICRPAS